MANCPICNEEADIGRSTHFFAKIINCVNCGKFMIENSVFINDDIPLQKKACILYYLSNRDEQEKLIPHFHDNFNWEDGLVEQSNRYMVSVESLFNLFPTNIVNKIDMIILNLAHKLKYVGNSYMTVYDENEYLYPYFFIDPQYGENTFSNQFEEMHSLLEDEGFIKSLECLGDDENTYTLSAKGWNKVYQLQKTNHITHQVFIAMWFNEQMFRARKSICDAIKNCGYIPIIIDVKEHNNQIVPEIFHEIKKSTFVIADITGHRTGVYYEAGYAEALDKQVILTCRSDDFEGRHFDISQKNTIVWIEETDLYNRLVARIEATIGRR